MTEAGQITGEPPAGRNGEAGVRQPTNGSEARSKLKDWMAIIVAVLVSLGILLGGMQWMISSNSAPIFVRLDQIDKNVQKLDGVVHDEFRGVRKEIVDLQVGLAKVEGLLGQSNQDRGQSTSILSTHDLATLSYEIPWEFHVE